MPKPVAFRRRGWPSFAQVGDGQAEFTPTPAEGRALIASGYRTPFTMLVRFENDAIDETPAVAEVLQRTNPAGAILLTFIPPLVLIHAHFGLQCDFDSDRPGRLNCPRACVAKCPSFKASVSTLLTASCRGVGRLLLHELLSTLGGLRCCKGVLGAAGDLLCSCPLGMCLTPG